MSRSIGWTSLTTWPPIRMSPPVISSRPAVRRRTVVLPEPEGPTKTQNSPSAMVRSSSSTATVPPGKIFVTPLKRSSAIALSTSVCVLGDQVAVPERAALRRPPLGREVHRHDSEAARVAVLPLEVVEERPHVVGADVHSLGDRALEGGHVVAHIGEAPRVLDHVAAVERWVVEGGAVLGDHEGEVAVITLEPQKELRERVRHDPPAHRRVRALARD